MKSNPLASPLENGADPNAYTYAKRGSTLHDIAAVNSMPTMFELLIAHSAGLEDNDALHSAAE